MLSACLTLSLLLAGCTLALPEEDATADEDETIRPGVWTMAEPVPTPRTEVATTILEDELIVIGGIEDAQTPSATVEALDLKMHEWRTLPELPAPLHHARAVTLHGAVHVLGGYNAIPFQATPTHLSWQPDDDAWTPQDPLPTPRGAHGATVLDEEIYLVGGVGPDGELLEEVHVYDPEEGTWSAEEGLPTPREHLAVAALNGTLHALAGREGGLDTNLATHEALTPGEGWDERAPVPTPRGGLYGASVAGHVIAAGGEGEDTFDEVEAYDPDTRNWTALPSLLTPRHGLGVDAWGNSLVTTAGGLEPGFSVSGQVEILPLAAAGPNGDDA